MVAHSFLVAQAPVDFALYDGFSDCAFCAVVCGFNLWVQDECEPVVESVLDFFQKLLECLDFFVSCKRVA